MRQGRKNLGAVVSPARLLHVTAAMYLIASILYFFGFETIEGEASIWAVLSVGGALMLARAGTVPPGGVAWRIITLALLSIGGLANWLALTVWFALAPDTEYVVGYLGPTTRWYAWPHVAILVLTAVLILVLIFEMPSLSRRRASAIDATHAGPGPSGDRRRGAGALAFAGAGIGMGGLALELWLGPVHSGPGSGIALALSIIMIATGLGLSAGGPADDSEKS